MSDQESTNKRDEQTLQELFIDVTGETEVTNRQNEEVQKEVVSSPESDSKSTVEQIDIDPKANGFEDAIGDPAPE